MNDRDKEIEKNVAEVLEADYNNAKSDQPSRGSFGSDIDGTLQSLSDQFFNELKERNPHKEMVGDRIEEALLKIFGRDNYNTNFDPIYVDDCVKEKVLIFVLRDDQKKMFNDFVKNHRCKYLNNPFNAGFVGSNLGFFFRDTSLGLVASVKCNCGVEEDLTDADNW